MTIYTWNYQLSLSLVVQELLAVLTLKVKRAMQEPAFENSLLLADLRRLLENPDDLLVRVACVLQLRLLPVPFFFSLVETVAPEDGMLMCLLFCIPIDSHSYK